jgi:hypothetical protein
VHIARFSYNLEATGQRRFESARDVVKVGNIIGRVTWLGQSPFNSAQSVIERVGWVEHSRNPSTCLANKVITIVGHAEILAL